MAVRTYYFIILLFFIPLFIAGCGGGDGEIPVNSGSGVLRITVLDDSLKTPIAGASVTTNPKTETYVSDAQGLVTISNLISGTFSITAEKTGYNKGTTSAEVRQNKTTLVNVFMKRTFSPTAGGISGKVVDDISGAPLANATITTSPPTVAVLSNAQGDFSIMNLVAGVFSVNVQKTGYKNTSVQVTVTDGNITPVSISVPPTGNTGIVTGIITSKLSGTPLSGVTVFTVPATQTITTNLAGEYTLNSVPIGQYKLYATLPGYDQDSSDLLMIDLTKPLTLDMSLTYQTPKTGLVAYYPFAKNSLDQSGNGNHATVNGAVLDRDRFNTNENSYALNGTNSYISVSKVLIPQSAPSSYTFSLWIRKNSTGKAGTLFSDRGAASTSGSYKYRVRWLEDDKIGFQMFNGTSFTQLKTLTTLSANTWYFVTIVFDAAKSEMSVYINETLEANNNNTFWSAAGNPTTFGVILNPTEQFFDGILDDIRIYNRALTVGEIQQIYREK